MKKPFDPTKPVQTRDGRPARIICADRKDPSIPIVALYASGDYEGASYHSADGTQVGIAETDGDLINITERTEKFANFYPNYCGSFFMGAAVHPSVKAAVSARSNRPGGVAKVTFEDGIPVSIEVVEII